MVKHAAMAAAAIGLVLVVPAKTLPPTGSWNVDTRHSHAQLTTDGTTDYGKKKMNVTVGFARMFGGVKLDGDNSKFDFVMYPASSMAPPIDEEGKVKIEWFKNYANNTLICFHSKGAKQTADGRYQTTGTLILTRVDRNVEANATEAYTGPVYGPPMIHRIPHEGTTFVFDFPNGSNRSGEILALGATGLAKEDFPQVLKAVIATYWPPVVQDKNCQLPTVSENYEGAMCTGTFLQPAPLPSAPNTAGAEDYPGSGSFNSVVGEHLTIAVHMWLAAGGGGAASAN